jgi:hypothetical protein
MRAHSEPTRASGNPLTFGTFDTLMGLRHVACRPTSFRFFYERIQSMATTRQRGRSTKTKVPEAAVQPTSASDGASEEQFAPAVAVSGLGAIPAEGSQARFVGEEIVYTNREERIAELAYSYAHARGFEPGHEVEDWLRAEKEVDTLLAGGNITD